MIYRRGRGRRQNETPELEITPFMNLMVVLVPFLLITAVFTRVTVLQLDLPAASSEETEEPDPPLQLEITVREDRIEVGDRTRGLFGSFPVADEGAELEQLTERLAAIKAEFPDTTTATVLLEPAVEYDRLIQVMDAVRQTDEATLQPDGEFAYGELFPEISIGDAPVLSDAE